MIYLKKLTAQDKKETLLPLFCYAMTICLASIFSLSPLWTSFGCLLAVVSAVILLRPIYAFYILLVAIQCQYIYIIPVSLGREFSIGSIVILLLLLIWLTSRLLGSSPAYTGTACDTLLLLFLCLMAFSLLWADNLKEGLYSIVKLAVFLGVSFCATVSLVNSDKRVNTILWILIITGSIAAVISLISVQLYPDYKAYYRDLFSSIVLNIQFNTDLTGRRGHAISHPLTTSYWLNFSITAAFMKRMTSTKNAVLLTVLILLMLTGHLCTLSKGPFLALMFGMMFFLWMTLPTRKYFLTWLSVGLLTVIVCYVAANADVLYNAIRFTAQQLSATNDESSVGTRLFWWTLCLKESFGSYGFGIGAGGLRDLLLTASKPGPHAHSVLISLIGELGFPGVLLYVLIHAIVIKKIWFALNACRNEYFKRILLLYGSGYIMFFVYLVFNYDYLMFQAWWYMGFGFALAEIAKKTDENYREDTLPFFNNRHGRSIVFTPGRNEK